MEARDNYFVQERDSVADATDEYIKIGESTTIESLKRFYRAVVEEFTSTNNDINVLEASHPFANLIQGPTRFWHKHVLHDIMTICIIMQHMIIEDEHDVDASIEGHIKALTPDVEMMLDENTRFKNF
ncbi:hypothetical protein Ddye_029094 [Dipteronia dyeriana]|uniref:Uncharacterized protein n=1 Tax=Dipteronia dyeriana TaxID=168575 RepID=A0AAD9TEI1_9ROSI|nr:hypothetical protein Ddye_029094 [Dipteronia dyeriana]